MIDTDTLDLRRRWLWIAGLLLCTPAAFAADYDAQLHWYRKAALGTPVSGVVEKVHVQAGDRVREGQPLVELDRRVPEADVQALKAELLQAENDLAEAGRELGRTQELYDRTLLADRDLQLAIIARDAAAARLSRVRASLVQAEWLLSHSTIRAPYDGVVVKLAASVGQTVVSQLQSTPLLEVAGQARMLARARVRGGELDALHRGAAAEVEVAGRRYRGDIVRIALEPFADDPGRYAVDVLFETDGAGLRVGQAAKVSFR